MGQVASIIKALSCDSCAKYVFNAFRCHSSCLDCCEFDMETTEVDLPDDNNQYSVEVEGCCEARSK